jgi:hypothetical protein
MGYPWQGGKPERIRLTAANPPGAWPGDQLLFKLYTLDMCDPGGHWVA